VTAALWMPEVLVGESPAMRDALALVERFAPTAAPIVLVGPTGVGKEVLARHIHTLSGRKGRFVAVNCAALPREMAESLLFGHRRGAFSGAVESRRGHVEVAHQGTLLLDELLCLPADGQAKLLRALDTGAVQPLGEEEERLVDVRFLAAVQGTLPAALAAGGVRYDLFQRLAGAIISLPALAARQEDVVPLARYFAALGGRTLAAGAERVLLGYPWPGNVRELRQVVERAGVFAPNGTLSPAALAEAIRVGAPALPGVHGGLPDGDDGFAERWRLLLACEANGCSGDAVARALGVHRATLFRRLKRAGLSLRRLQRSQSRTESRDSVRLCDSEPASLGS
jgi:DNA-binding NtrC family response regulator